MKFEQLKQSLKQEILPCYMINGGESYLTTYALKMIETSLNLSYPDFNKTVFYDSSQKTAKDIVAACEELPFVDEKRIIIVHDYVNKKNESEKNIFLNYLKNPNLSTCLVFFSTNKSDFFSSIVSNQVCNIECDKISFSTLQILASSVCKNFNINFTPQALTKLYDYCNYSPTKVVIEITKFSSISSSKDVFDEEDVEENVTKDIEYVIFDLTTAITQKNSQKVYMLIKTMLDNKEQPINIISSISNHFRRLLTIARSDENSAEISKLLNIKEFAVTKYLQQSANFSQKRLKEIFDLCLETEFMAKSGKIGGEPALNYLISSILK